VKLIAVNGKKEKGNAEWKYIAQKRGLILGLLVLTAAAMVLLLRIRAVALRLIVRGGFFIDCSWGTQTGVATVGCLQRPVSPLPLEPLKRGLGKEEDRAYPSRSDLLCLLFMRLGKGVEGVHKVKDTTGVKYTYVPGEVSKRMLAWWRYEWWEHPDVRELGPQLREFHLPAGVFPDPEGHRRPHIVVVCVQDTL
jgi:hypothetical protein